MNGGTNGVAKRVAEVLAALAATLTFIYLFGAAVLWVRLFVRGLPREAVITVLPRELLLSIGLRSLVVPVLVFGALGMVVLLRVFRGRLGSKPGWGQAVEETAQAARLPVLLAIALGIAGAFTDLEDGWLAAWFVGALVVLLGVAAISAGFAHLSFRAIAVAALLVGLVATVGRLVIENDPQFDEAVVCVKDQGEDYRGLFIGETGESIYLGIEDENERPIDLDDNGYVVEVPRERVREIRIGADDSVGCSFAPALRVERSSGP